jgi:ubiquinone/menaquinone biosynthesis C-methylase UbiE
VSDPTTAVPSQGPSATEAERRRPSPEDIATWQRLEVQHHRPGAVWKAVQLLVAGSKGHAFLDRPWITPLLRLTPPSLRRPLAIRLLALSPHYWIYQWNNRYAPALGRAEILGREVERVAASRKALCDQLLKPHLRPDMTVLDLGTGPGFLARELSRHVAKVIACDVSRGVLACAQCLNPAVNLTYVANAADRLGPVPDASIAVAVSFAVLQHVAPDDVMALFLELRRVLKPGGVGLCHVRLEDRDDPRQWFTSPTPGWRARRVQPRMVYFRAPELLAELTRLGFVEVSVIALRETAATDDDVLGDHLVCFRRPAGAPFGSTA